MLHAIRLAISAVLFTSFSLTAFSSNDQYLIVGTGGVTGVYYPTGGAICRMINRDRDRHGIRCGVESTSGSVYNLEKIRQLDLDMGVVQSDWQHHAVLGTGEFKSQGPDRNLRSVFSIYSEPFTLVVRADSNIKTLDDLKGKRVNIGNQGSGHRATMEVLMQALGWSKDYFSQVYDVSSADQSTWLCENKFDAMIFMAGHPSASIKKATTECHSVLLNVSGQAVENLISQGDYYQKITIPAGMYRGNNSDIETFGVGATFVTSKSVSEEVIYQLTKSVFDNLLEFKNLHPAFHSLKKTKMAKDGLSAPVHRGALKYYKEVGLK